MWHTALRKWDGQTVDTIRNVSTDLFGTWQGSSLHNNKHTKYSLTLKIQCFILFKHSDNIQLPNPLWIFGFFWSNYRQDKVSRNYIGSETLFQLTCRMFSQKNSCFFLAMQQSHKKNMGSFSKKHALDLHSNANSRTGVFSKELSEILVLERFAIVLHA